MPTRSVDVAHLRSVVLAGHAGAGKTTLGEQILFRAGAISRLGRVDDGTASLDFEAEEQKRKASLSLGVASFDSDGHRITLVDAPGYPDFQSEVISGFAAVDGALFVMDASAGVEAGLEFAVAMGRSTGRAACFFINKCDRENADPTAALDNLRATFGNKIAPLHLAIGAADTFSGYVDLVHRKAYRWEGSKEVEIPVPDELADEVARRRDQLLEAAAEADDDVLTKYLEGEEISDAELDACLHRGVRDSILAPVLVGSAAKGIGIAALLDAFVRYLPSPDEEGPVRTADAKSGAEVAVEPDPSGPLVVRVFKTTADPFVGRLSYLRVYSGTLKSQGHVWNANRNEDERIGQLLLLHGKDQEPIGEIKAGEIGAVAKLSVTETGDTLSTKEKALVLPALTFPKPTLMLAIEPVSKGDLDKMGPALQRLLEEEPTIRLERTDAGEQVLVAMGEAHIAVTLERLKRKFGAAIATKTPKVPYRETIRGKTQAHGRYKKQTGGHGMFGDVWIELEPNPGGGVEFAETRRRRLGPEELLPGRRKGDPRDRGRGRARRLPALGLQGDAVRRVVPPGRLERALVQDRSLDGAQGRGAAGQAGAARADHVGRGARARAVHGRGEPRPERPPRPRPRDGPGGRDAGDHRARAPGRVVRVCDRAAVTDGRPGHLLLDGGPLRGGAGAPRREGDRGAQEGRGGRRPLTPRWSSRVPRGGRAGDNAPVAGSSPEASRTSCACGGRACTERARRPIRAPGHRTPCVNSPRSPS